MGHERRVAVNERFADIWQWLRAGGPQRVTSTGGQDFTASAHIPRKGYHIGQKAIVIKDAATGQIDAYIYECCWGRGENDSGTWIGQYVEPLDNAVPSSPVGGI